MPLNIIESNLKKVKPELHALYVKQSDGKFKLALSDLDQHVEDQLKPLKSDLETTRKHERNFWRTAWVPHYGKPISILITKN
jgi:hypothetical protein